MDRNETIGYVEVTPARLATYCCLVLALVVVAIAFGAYLGVVLG